MKKYFFNSTSKEEMIRTCMIVLDTSVLLHAYQWRGITTKAIIDVMKLLSEENRLKIPYQAVVEFSKNRPALIIQLLNMCHNKISSLSKPENVASLFPVFDGQKFFDAVIESQKSLSTATDSYLAKLKEVRKRLESLLDNDPVLGEYAKIIENCIIGEYNEEELQAFSEEARKRYDKNIPPGFEDKGKKDGGVGDYIIWKAILDLGKALDTDIALVSGEKKRDWVVTDRSDDNGKVLGARRELVWEYYEHCGKSFRVITPLDLIETLVPTTPSEVKKDLSNKIDMSVWFDPKIIYKYKSWHSDFPRFANDNLRSSVRRYIYSSDTDLQLERFILKQCMNNNETLGADLLEGYIESKKEMVYRAIRKFDGATDLDTLLKETGITEQVLFIAVARQLVNEGRLRTDDIKRYVPNT